MGNLAPKDPVYVRWKSSDARLVFPREHLRRLQEPVSTLLFKQGGWMNRLYEDLSGYVHSRPNSADGALWQSNGPIYVGKVFNHIYRLQAVTYAACYLMVRVGRQHFALPVRSNLIYEPQLASKELIKAYRALFTSGSSQ